MKRLVKYGWIFLTLVIFTGGAALFIVSYYPALLKPLVEHHVKESSQRALWIAGNMQLSLFPRFSLSLTDVSLSEYQRDDLFATIEEISITMALLPLFSKQLVVDRVYINGFKANLIRYQDGSVNIADLLGNENASFFDSVQMAQIEIENSQSRFQDQKTQHILDLESVHLTAMNVTADSIQRMTLLGRLTVDAEEEDGIYSFAKPLEAQLEIEDISFGQEKLTSGSVLLTMQTDHNDLDTETREYFSTHISINGFDRVEDLLTSRHVHLAIALQHNGQIAQATVDTAFELKTTGLTGTLSDIHLAFDFFHPEFTRKPIHGQFKGDMDMDLLSQLLQLDIQGQFDGNAFNASARLQNFAQNIHTFAIAIDSVDLIALLPIEQSNFKNMASAVRSKNASFPDFSHLEKLGLNGSIQIGKLYAGDIQLSGVQLMIQPGKATAISINPNKLQ